MVIFCTSHLLSVSQLCNADLYCSCEVELLTDISVIVFKRKDKSQWEELLLFRLYDEHPRVVWPTPQVCVGQITPRGEDKSSAQITDDTLTSHLFVWTHTHAQSSVSRTLKLESPLADQWSNNWPTSPLGHASTCSLPLLLSLPQTAVDWFWNRN